MARRTRKARPLREAAAVLPPTDDVVACAACGQPMPRERRDVAGFASCPACTERTRFVEDVDSSKATGFEIRVAPPPPPTVVPKETGGKITPRPAAEERPLRRNDALADALGLNARKPKRSASKAWGGRRAAEDADESELARQMRQNRRDGW